MAGTFILKPTGVVSGGTPITDGNVALPSDFAGWVINSPTTLLQGFTGDVAADASFLQAWCANDTAGSASLDKSIRFEFTGNCYYLDGSLSPVSSLPVGMGVATATVNLLYGQSFPPSVGSTQFFLQQAAGVNGPADTLTFPYTIPIPPSIQGDGIGFRVLFSVGPSPDSGSVFLSDPAFVPPFSTTNIYISGTYDVIGTSAWYENPDTNHLQYSTSDPGDPWVLLLTDPVPDLDEAGIFDTYHDGVAMAATSATAGGCIGTAVTLTGTGFGDGATVTFGGVTAGSIVVVDENTITCVSPTHADGNVDIVITNADSTSTTLVNGYVYFQPWWVQTFTIVVNGVDFVFQFPVQQCVPPVNGAWELLLPAFVDPVFHWWNEPDLGWWAFQPDPPAPLPLLIWFLSGAPSDDDGWFVSPASFGGSIFVVGNSNRPKRPRTWNIISGFATGSMGWAGGSPAGSVTVRNRMVYPSSAYSGFDPSIRIFDGFFDHELATVPPLPGQAATAVMSMLSANGTIYFTTFDGGSSSADWHGRVFSLDMFSGVATPIGDPFTGGDLPYALAWHMGRLWVGTNNGIGTVGKVYFFRPNIDTTWTLDHNVSTETAGSVASMASFGGKLYVGTVNVDAVRGKVLQRDETDTWTVTRTGSGGTAKLNNGFLTLYNYQDTTLYASYWNDDATPISHIDAFDGTTWTTSFTASTVANRRPYIVFMFDGTFLFAVAGGMGRTGAIQRSDDGGATWLDLTAQLPESNKTLLPIVGIEVI